MSHRGPPVIPVSVAGGESEKVVSKFLSLTSWWSRLFKPCLFGAFDLHDHAVLHDGQHRPESQAVQGIADPTQRRIGPRSLAPSVGRQGRRIVRFVRHGESDECGVR